MFTLFETFTKLTIVANKIIGVNFNKLFFNSHELLCWFCWEGRRHHDRGLWWGGARISIGRHAYDDSSGFRWILAVEGCNWYWLPTAYTWMYNTESSLSQEGANVVATYNSVGDTCLVMTILPLSSDVTVLTLTALLVSHITKSRWDRKYLEYLGRESCYSHYSATG